MKNVRLISLLLILMMAVTLLGGCKSADRSDLPAANDSWVEIGESEEPEEEPSEEKKPEEEKKPTEEKEPEKEPADEKEEAPKEETPKEEEPSQEPSKEEEPEEEKPLNNEDIMTPITKESSGTVVKMLTQNVKHGGTTLHGNKGDGTGINIYNRLRRFKSLVLEEDPDIIFNQEARRSAINFFTQDDDYFAATYTTIYRYRAWSDSHPYTEDLGGDQSEPVLFKKAKYKELDSGHFWISENLKRDGKSFCDAMPDVSSWAKLQDKESGEIIWIICYHPYPQQNKMGIPGLALLHNWMDDHVGKNEYCFIGGDYNLQYRNHAAYDISMEYDRLFDLRDMAVAMWADGLCELGLMASGHNRYMEGKLAEPEPKITYNFPHVTNPQIDHIMAKPMPNMAVDYYGFNYKTYDYAPEGISRGHISDHFGLVVHARIGTKVDYSRYQDRYEYGENPMYFDPATVEWKDHA